MSDQVVAISTVPCVAQVTSDDRLVELFLANRQRPNTQSAYRSDVARFRLFVAKPLQTVTLGDVQAYAASLIGAPSTISRRLSAVKSLFKLGHRLGWLVFDVAATVPLPSIRDSLAERILSEEQVQRLFWSEKHPRNLVLLRLVYGAGIRVSEACALRWRDLAVRDESGQVTVFGKGGKTRAILLPPVLWTRVTELRGNAGPDDPVFRSRKGGALRRAQVHVIVKAAAKRAKLPPGVSAHWLRHAHASHALDRSAPVHVVQATLGHASLTTTTRYTHVRPGDSSARYLTA
jgi:integrase/recombinase XerD